MAELSSLLVCTNKTSLPGWAAAGEKVSDWKERRWLSGPVVPLVFLKPKAEMMATEERLGSQRLPHEKGRESKNPHRATGRCYLGEFSLGPRLWA